MLLTIYDRYGSKKTDLSPNDSSTQSKELQSDNLLTLTFTLYEHIELEVNDYIDFEGERYWLLEAYQPTQKSTVEWVYDVKLYGIESLIKRFLVLKTVDGANEPVFTLTAPPREHVAMIVKCINDGMDNTTNWKVGTVEGAENIVVDYEGTYCDEGLKAVADAVGTEWWIEGQTINVCRCEHGEELTLGYGKGITSIEKDNADNAKFYTRLFPIGSSRNIDAEKYGYSRLQLPYKNKYVDVNTDKYGVIHQFEADAFADIYPRRVGKVSGVRSEDKIGEDGNPFTIYYFKDEELPFDPNEYEIGGLVKRVSFQEGSELAGIGEEEDGTYYLECNYNSKTKEFEIITIWPYDDDTQLPGGPLIPKVGDEYILWNIRMPDVYYTLAEQEFLTAVEKYNADNAVDISVYKCPTDHVWMENSGEDLFIGRRVRLESDKYFPTGKRESRITKITRKVNLPSQADLEISDALSTGAMEKISSAINDAKNYTKSLASGTALPDIIRSWDTTLPTDTNLFSARRSQKEFISKTKADTAQKKIRFLEGINVGDFVQGEQGGTFDEKGNGELLTLVIRNLMRSTKFVDGFTGEGFQLWMDDLSHLTIDTLTVRQTMSVFELLIQKVRSIGGQFVVSAANGKIKEVDTSGDNYVITFEQDNTFVAGDLMRCAVMSGVEQRAYWVEILSASTDNVVVEASQFDGTVPKVGDECVLMGNTTNRLRQNIISIAATEDGQPRVDVLDGISDKTFKDSLRVRLGNLDGISDDRFPLDNQPHGNGLYGDNVYLVGTFMLTTGEDILTKFNIMEGKIEAAVEGLREDFLENKGYLSNPSFNDGLDKWNTENEATFFLLGNRWIWTNDAPLSNKTNYTCVSAEEGRKCVFIRNKYILQKNSEFRDVPQFTEINSEGELLAETMYLSFYYKCTKAGRLQIDFENVDKAGFENFNAFTVDEEITETDGFVMFSRDGLWNGTGDFKLNFTGDIYLYMLVLSTDRVTALAHKYKTLFEQSERLIKISAAVFDKDEHMLEETGLMVNSKMTGLYAIDGDGNLKSFVGTEQGGVKIAAKDNITLEGLVTANKNFKILEDGSIEAVNAKLTGEINAKKGDIGGFKISDNGIACDGDASLEIGTEAFNVSFKSTQEDKTVEVNGGEYSYVPTSYTFCYKENRRVTTKNSIPDRYNWQNIMVADVMSIDYYSRNLSTPGSNSYGYQYAALGSGHLCLNGIVEGHCIDFVDDFTANDQVKLIQLPMYCNRLCVKTDHTGDIIVLPDIKSMLSAIGCGIINNNESQNFSFTISVLNTGTQTIYVAGYCNDNISNKQSPLKIEGVYPKIHNKTSSVITSIKGISLSPYNVLQLLLVYDGTNYDALIC